MATSRKPKASASSALPQDWDYEQTVAQIEDIVSLIEAGEMNLVDVFEQFTVAADYLKQCDTFLNERAAHVDILIEHLTDDEF